MFLKYLQGTALFILISISSDQASCLQQRKLLQNSPSILLKLELELQGESIIAVNLEDKTNDTSKCSTTNSTQQNKTESIVNDKNVADKTQKAQIIKPLDLSLYTSEKQPEILTREKHFKYILQKALSLADLKSLNEDARQYQEDDDIVMAEYIQQYGQKGGAFELLQIYISSYYDLQYPYAAGIIPDQALFIMPTEEEYNSEKTKINQNLKAFYSSQLAERYDPDSQSAKQFCDHQVRYFMKSSQIFLQALPKLTKLQLLAIGNHIRSQTLGGRSPEEIKTYQDSYQEFYMICKDQISSDLTIPEL
ncbi:UNKNOWN [Stylonychia lemnae]|uniref:Uncharacterized protein n=1 Tax=Stylonychia lemnae TaxID=5949 RepID=A0A078AQS2_STYLE|nr:UNKNOWN [Stylonychia lemnae]|eukprot:CDW84564.1 UNKNOWN [Stylonychia lemnae]